MTRARGSGGGGKGGGNGACGAWDARKPRRDGFSMPSVLNIVFGSDVVTPQRVTGLDS